MTQSIDEWLAKKSTIYVQLIKFPECHTESHLHLIVCLQKNLKIHFPLQTHSFTRNRKEIMHDGLKPFFLKDTLLLKINL